MRPVATKTVMKNLGHSREDLIQHLDSLMVQDSDLTASALATIELLRIYEDIRTKKEA